ncbi:winged helix-turn-helix transcriptional regulator [Sphingobacterium sp.]
MIPPRVEYCLTEKSERLVPVFKEIANWGNQNLQINKEIAK